MNVVAELIIRNATDNAKYEHYEYMALNYTLPVCPTVIKII